MFYTLYFKTCLKVRLYRLITKIMLKILKKCCVIQANLSYLRSLSTITNIKHSQPPLIQKQKFYLHQFSNYSTNNLEEQKQDDNKQETTTETPVYPDLSDIINGDEQLEYKYKLLQLEIEVMRQSGSYVPTIEFLKRDHWVELLSKGSRAGRGKYLTFLFKLEMKKRNFKEKKLKQQQERLENLKDKEEVKEGEIRYGLTDNNILIRIRDTTINQLYNNKLIQAMQFGEKLVFDCGYDDEMSSRESINCAKQLMMVFAENRIHDEPFDIHFCNFNPKKTMAHYLQKNIPTMYDPWFPMNIHEESYLDLFPKENLVYLTPHCQQELVYNPDDVYIIGGIVDKVNNDPVSLAKAKKQGLRMAKFPLERYLDWGAGSGKSLTLNQVVMVLLDLKKTKNWKYALRHVPRRKLFYDRTGEHIKQYDSLRYDKDDHEDEYARIRRENWNEYMKNKRNDNNSFTNYRGGRRNQNYGNEKYGRSENASKNEENKLFRINNSIFKD